MQNFDKDTFKYEHTRWEHYTDKWSAYMNNFENLGVIIAGVNFPIDYSTGKFHEIWDFCFPGAEIKKELTLSYKTILKYHQRKHRVRLK